MKKPQLGEKKKFVAMPIKMFAYAHEGLFVTKKDENAFILYYMLDVMTRNIYTWGSVETSVSLLSRKLPLKTKESDNKKEIKRLLLSLHGKGFIKIFFEEESFEYDTLLTIHMLDLDDTHIMEAVQSDNFWHTGWVPVTEEMFKACNHNAKHFKLMIYLEWRMFRGQENEGTYRISLSEWEKVLDISHPTAVRLIKEVEELNLIDKIRGAMYKDSNGKPRQETNRYALVSQEEREERKAEGKEKDTDSLAKKHNTEVLAKVNEMDVTDPRVVKTNLFNPSKTVYLNGYDWYVWDTTECSKTKEQGTRRLEALRKASMKAYNNLVSEGKKEKAKQERVKHAKKVAEEREEANMNRPDFYGHVDFEEDRPTYAEVKARREAKEAKIKDEKEERRRQGRLFASELKEESQKRIAEMLLRNDALNDEYDDELVSLPF